MQTIETNCAKEARRCRFAQFSGRSTTLILSGAKVSGVVWAVKPDQPKAPSRWTITIIPEQSANVNLG
ncbi:MAG TPA: hypothetical protein VIQ05_17565 [Tardiphaga sp.]